jgi:putative membrane protein
MFLKTVRMNALAVLLSGVVGGGVGCSSDDSAPVTTGGSAGSGGSAGTAGTAADGSAGTANGGSTGTGSGGAAGSGGSAGTATGGSAGTVTGGSAGTATGGAGGAAAADGGAESSTTGTGGAGGGRDGGNTAADASTDAQADLTDGQIAMVLTTANTGEIQEGQAELARGVVTEIRDFAQMMVADHTAANTRGAALFVAQGIMPAPSPVSTMLNADAMAQVMMLNTLTGTAVDRAYITGQVNAHQMVLTLIDTRLLPSAENAALRAELMTSRTAVAMHLDHARMLQADLSEGGLTVSDGGRDGAARDGAAGD